MYSLVPTNRTIKAVKNRRWERNTTVSITLLLISCIIPEKNWWQHLKCPELHSSTHRVTHSLVLSHGSCVPCLRSSRLQVSCWIPIEISCIAATNLTNRSKDSLTSSMQLPMSRICKHCVITCRMQRSHRRKQFMNSGSTADVWRHASSEWYKHALNWTN